MTLGNHFPTTPSRQSLKPSKSWLRVEPFGGGFRVAEARFYWNGFEQDDESGPSADTAIYPTRVLAQAALAVLETSAERKNLSENRKNLSGANEAGRLAA